MSQLSNTSKAASGFTWAFPKLPFGPSEGKPEPTSSVAMGRFQPCVQLKLALASAELKNLDCRGD